MSERGWTPIPGWPTHEVARDGAVRRVAAPNGRARLKELSPYVRRGYNAVVLCNGPRKLQVYIHRLVARVFIPNPEGKPHVNHKNGDRFDNRIENLEWVTPHENNRHSWRVLGNAKLERADVRNIRASREPHSALARKYGVSRSAISRVKSGDLWGHVE